MTVATDNLNSGDTAFADFSKYGRIDVRKGTVIKKSPTGVVQVDFGTSLPYSFKKEGWQRGAATYDAARLITADEYARLEERMIIQKAERFAMDRVKIVAGVNIMQSNKAEIIAKLEAAIEAVKAIPDKEG